MRTASLLLIGCLGSSGWSCTSEPDDRLCDTAAIQAALADAAAGDVVELGACRIAGPLTVPAGVTLQGAGRGETVLFGAEDEVVLELEPGTPAPVARDLGVEASGVAGILANGAGELVLERVDVAATRGIALGVQDADVATLTDLVLTGPITPESALRIAGEPTPDETATHGLVLVRVADARISDLTANRFANFGALLFETRAVWSGGAASGNLGTGLMAQAGSVELHDVAIEGTLQGARLTPVFGAVFSAGASVESTGLSVTSGDGYGLVHASALVHHTDLIASSNGDAAVWIQDATDVAIDGAQLADNRLAGIVVLDSSGVTLTDVTTESTALATAVFAVQGRVRIGDGIQLVGSTEDILLEGVTLTNNERVGLLLDLAGGSDAGIDLVGVTATGSGGELGVVAQGGDLTDGWDADVTRAGDTAATDAAFFADAGTLDYAEPLTDVPMLEEDSIRGLMGPNN